jgi:tetratricopeptide (TPR) repeat protein
LSTNLLYLYHQTTETERMEERDFDPSNDIKYLALEFEAMQETGTVSFLEKTDFLRLVEYYENDEDLAQALTVSEYALEQHPFSDEFFMRKAQLLIQMGQSEEALQWLSESLLYGPDEVDLAMLQAEAFLQLKEYEEALIALRTIHGQGCSREDLSDLYFCEGLIFEAQEDFTAMFHAIRRALRLNPDNEAALERMWLCTELTRKYDASIKIHTQIIDQNPYAYLAWYNLGNAHACLGDWEKAIEAFEFTIVINEKFDYAYRDCIAACLEAGRFNQALELFNDLQAFQQPDAEILLKAGECYEMENRLERAVELYQQASQLSDNDPDIHFKLGKAYAIQSRWDLALYSLEKAVSLDGRREEFLTALADVYFQTDDLDKAGALFQQATEVAPEQSGIWIQYAAFLIALGEIENAYETADEGSWYVPSPELEYLKSACLFLMGKYQEGRICLLQALTDNYDLHEMLFEIAPSWKRIHL